MKKCPNCGYVDRRMDNFSYQQFSIFWTNYPRKVGKGAAEKIWAKMKGDEELFQKIMIAVENQKMGESWKKENGIYIPHPSTWLNQRRWEDEPVVQWKDPFEKKPNDPTRLAEVNAALERLKEREWQKRQKNIC